MKSIIVAYDKNRLIGADNSLPWAGKMSGDMRHFRELTTGNVVIMGRKTYDSICSPLLNRQNIVISRQSINIPGVLVAHSLDEAYKLVDKNKEIFIIGGGQIYEQSLPSVDRIIATEIDYSFKGDANFPVLSNEWYEVSRDFHKADVKNKYDYSFVIYTKQQSAL
jgi:dihydrofolate reductase